MNKKMICLTAGVALVTLGAPVVVNNSEPTSIVAKASSAKYITARKIKVGDQIKPGYYRITIPKGESKITGDHMDVTIGAHKSSNHVTSYTMELKKGDELTVGSHTRVKFTPIKHVNRSGQTDLTAGVWEVGTDLEPGNYKITKDSNTNGGMVQVEDEANGQIEDIPGNQGGSDVQLKKGQKIRTSFDHLKLVQNN